MEIIEKEVKAMRWLKKEFREKITGIVPVGYRGGRKIFDVIYADGTSKEMFAEEVEALLLPEVR